MKYEIEGCAAVVYNALGSKPHNGGGSDLQPYVKWSYIYIINHKSVMYPFLTFWLPTVHCFSVGRWTIGDSRWLRSHTISSPSLPFRDWSDTSTIRYAVCVMTGRAIYNIDYTLILQRPRLQYTTILYSYETKHMSVYVQRKEQDHRNFAPPPIPPIPTYYLCSRTK